MASLTIWCTSLSGGTRSISLRTGSGRGQCCRSPRRPGHPRSRGLRGLRGQSARARAYARGGVAIPEDFLGARQPAPALHIIGCFLQPVGQAGDHAADHLLTFLGRHVLCGLNICAGGSRRAFRHEGRQPVFGNLAQIPGCFVDACQHGGEARGIARRRACQGGPGFQRGLLAPLLIIAEREEIACTRVVGIA